MNFPWARSSLPSRCDISSLGCEVGEVPALPSSRRRARVLSHFVSRGRSRVLRVV